MLTCRVVTKGIKADCNHLVKNIHPCTFLTASFCSVLPRRAGVLSRNDVLQKTSLCKTRKAIYNTDVVNWHTRFCLEPPASVPDRTHSAKHWALCPDACVGVVDFRYDRENDICGSFKNYEFFEVGPEYIIL